MPSQPSPPARGGRVLLVGATAVAILALTPGMAAARAMAPERTAPAAGPSRERPAQDELSFVYFRDARTTTMSGSDQDITRARRYHRSGEPMLWFRRDGREYVVRDPDVLREVDELWEPVSRIGEEQGRIGARQGALGAEQGRYGGLQGAVGARQGAVGARQGAVGARLGLLAAREGMGVSAAERREIAREREALDREMHELGRQMERLDEEMREVSPPPRELDQEMQKLGREMAVLGRRMDDASRRAHAGMQRLVDRAIDGGTAQPVR